MAAGISFEETKNGRLFVFSYPSNLVLSDKITEQRTFSNNRLIIFPPAKVGKPTWRPIPPMDHEALNRILPGAPELHSYGIAAYPALPTDKPNGVKLIWGDQEDISLYKDTIIIFSAIDEHLEETSTLQDGFVRRLILWLRLSTMQWWIGREMGSHGGNLQFTFSAALNARLNLSIDSLPQLSVSATAPLAQSKAISLDIWRSCCALAYSGAEPDQIDLMYSDLFSLAAKDERSFLVLNVCNIVEMLRDRFLNKRKMKIGAFKTGSTDLLKHVSLGMKSVCGRDMKSEEPSAFEFLKSCYSARGNTAHGKPMIWLHQGVEAQWMNGQPFVELEAVGKIINWFRDVDAADASK